MQLETQAVQKDKDPNLMFIWNTCRASRLIKGKTDILQTASNKSRLKCGSLCHFFTYIFINTYNYAVCWRHWKLFALYFKLSWEHARGMSSGKNRINITQMQKSWGWCLRESKALSRAAVGATPAVPWAWWHRQGRAKPRGSGLNPALNGVSLFTYFLLGRHKFHCMATDHPNHWWKLGKFFWAYPRCMNKGSLWSIRESTVLWPLTDTDSFHICLHFSCFPLIS